MKTLQIHLPDNIDENEVTLILAVQLYDKGKLSLGQAAELMDMDKEIFMEQLGKYDVSLFGETIEDIKRDLGNA
jgi:predicted HTH domain antitoxin